jgi:hypothetical protein
MVEGEQKIIPIALAVLKVICLCVMSLIDYGSTNISLPRSFFS